MKYLKNNSLFQASQLTILLGFTVFAGLLIAEAFLLSWELWPLIPITIGVVFAWALHIQQRLTDRQRLWMNTAFVMFAF